MMVTPVIPWPSSPTAVSMASLRVALSTRNVPSPGLPESARTTNAILPPTVACRKLMLSGKLRKGGGEMRIPTVVWAFFGLVVLVLVGYVLNRGIFVGSDIRQVSFKMHDGTLSPKYV